MPSLEVRYVPAFFGSIPGAGIPFPGGTKGEHKYLVEVGDDGNVTRAMRYGEKIRECSIALR